MTDQLFQSAVNPAIARNLLRREMIAARLAIPAERWKDANARILGHLAGLLLPRAPGTLAFCWPIRAEADCRPLVARLIAAGWHAAMPTVVAADAPMEFRRWSPAAPMTVDPYGIPVPATAAGPVPGVVLLPLVSFDQAGYRLGYGGGYFDRTLAACFPRPLAIGVGFDLCAVASIHPEAHDMPLDLAVTESGIRRFKTP